MNRCKFQFVLLPGSPITKAISKNPQLPRPRSFFYSFLLNFIHPHCFRLINSFSISCRLFLVVFFFTASDFFSGWQKENKSWHTIKDFLENVQTVRNMFFFLFFFSFPFLLSMEWISQKISVFPYFFFFFYWKIPYWSLRVCWNS